MSTEVKEIITTRTIHIGQMPAPPQLCIDKEGMLCTKNGHTPLIKGLKGKDVVVMTHQHYVDLMREVFDSRTLMRCA